MSEVDFDTRLLEYFAGGECFVDLGCGAGGVCRALAGKYSRVIGLDFNPSKVKDAGRSGFWDFIRTDLNKPIELNDGIADGVLANQVIEHILDPMAFITEIHRLLKPGGMAVITTPNIRYLKHIWRILVRGKGPQTANGNTEDGPWDDGHVHYFTHKDLRELFSQMNFREINSRALIDLGRKSLLRDLFARHSNFYLIREFLSGNVLIIGIK